MARTQQHAVVVLMPGTAQGLYPSPRVVSRRVPLSAEALEALPADVRRAVARAYRPGTVVVLLVDEDDTVMRILVVNR